MKIFVPDGPFPNQGTLEASDNEARILLRECTL